MAFLLRRIHTALTHRQTRASQQADKRSRAFDYLRDGIILLDAEYCVIDANHAAQTLLGRQRRQIIGAPLLQVCKEQEDLLNLFLQLQHALKTTAVQPIHLTPLHFLKNKFFDGHGHTAQFLDDAEHTRANDQLEMSLKPLQDGGFMLTLKDTVGRNQVRLIAEHRLQELTIMQNIDKRISSTLNVDAVLAVAMDEVMDITGATAGFISIIETGHYHRVMCVAGAYPTRFIGQLVPPNIGTVGQVVKTQQPTFIRDVRQSEDYYPDIPGICAQMVIPLISHDKLIGILNLESAEADRFTHDLYEFAQAFGQRIAIAIENARLYTLSQKQLTELQKLYDQVSKLEQDKTEIIRIASHDLRNPIGTIIGYLDLMQMDEARLAPDHKEFVDMMMNLAGRINRIVKDILSLERFYLGSLHEEVDLRAITCAVVEEQQPQLFNKNHYITTDLPTHAVYVKGDAMQLHEAMANLLTNAIKYTPDGGAITVKLTQTRHSVSFVVIDTGYGIPEDLQQSLFQPFYRAVSAETSTIEGTGLGLHLVKNIVERHSGHIHFESVHGEGSTFGFELPRPTIS